MSELTWQMHDANEWRFGRMVRGVVRTPYYAEIYFDDERDKDYGWKWMVMQDGVPNMIRGRENSFEMAVSRAEEALVRHGLIPAI